MEDIKDEIVFFFDQKLFWDKSNRKYQTDSLTELANNGCKYIVRSESRNYQHSISTLIDYNTAGESTALENDQNGYNTEFVVKFFNSIVYRVVIEFSDVGAFYNVNWGVKNYLDENEKWFSHIPQKDLPQSILHNFSKVEAILQENLRIRKLESDELELKVDWLKSIPEFRDLSSMVSIRELLFGGLDLYNELNI